MYTDAYWQGYQPANSLTLDSKQIGKMQICRTDSQSQVLCMLELKAQRRLAGVEVVSLLAFEVVYCLCFADLIQLRHLVHRLCGVRQGLSLSCLAYVPLHYDITILCFVLHVTQQSHFEHSNMSCSCEPSFCIS